MASPKIPENLETQQDFYRTKLAEASAEVQAAIEAGIEVTC